MERNSATILGVPITSTELTEVLRKILDFESDLCLNKEREKMSKKLVIFTPNPEFIVEASRNPSFKMILNDADINLPDGSGLLLAGKLLGVPVRERISGADLVEELMRVGNKKKWTVGIAGARRGDSGETEALLEKLCLKYPDIRLINLDDPYYKTENDLPTGRTGKLQIVFACHGMVKQEKWIIENKKKINARVFMGVGGSLDFLAGFSKRAPRWMRVIGLEWLWRGLQRPEHFKRIWQAVIIFPLLVLKEKLS